MSTPTSPTTGTEMVLTPRQERLQIVRDDLAPGAKPAAIVPRTFVEVDQMCRALAGSGLVPKAFRGATGALDMMIVVMTGSELGIPPMAALRLFTTWDGVPRLMSEGIRAVLLTHQDIEYFEVSTCDDKHATWIGKRRGRPEKSATWTMERARRAKLDQKPNWQAFQEDMLNARASMQLGRMLAPDIIAGMRSLEEAQDGDFVDAQAVEVKRPEFAAPPVAVASGVTPELAMRGMVAALVPAPASEPAKTRTRRTPPIVVSAAAEHPTSEGGQTPAAGSASTAAAGDSSPTRPDSGEPAGGSATKFNAAVETARAADAARIPPPDAILDKWGQPIGVNPTPPASSTAPSQSSASDAGSAVGSGSGPGGDDGFGDDPTPAPAEDPSKNRLADFLGELARCVNQREVAACGDKWRPWTRARAEAGDETFRRTGSNSVAMAKAYATRKSEVPA